MTTTPPLPLSSPPPAAPIMLLSSPSQHQQKSADLTNFKSSFARSLSFSNTNQTKSLDFEISLKIAGNCVDDNSVHNNPSTSYTNNNNNNNNNFIDNIKLHHSPPQQQYSSSSSVKIGEPSSITTDVHNIFNWPRLQQDTSKNAFTTEIEVLRLRKECQNLIEDNRRLMNVAASCSSSASLASSSASSSTSRSSTNNEENMYCENSNTITTSVEEAMLQTQVESLQWQLKQVESSRQMYHAVMVEVVRFLERCHLSLNAIQQLQHQQTPQQNQIYTRSKSVNHVYLQDYSKIHKSTNDIQHHQQQQQQQQQQQHQQNKNSYLNESTSSKIHATGVGGGGGGGGGGGYPNKINDNSTYSTFRDYTWRRSPKRSISLSSSSSSNENIELDIDKLSQESFRLYRTVQNLLNLKEPILCESKSILLKNHQLFEQNSHHQQNNNNNNNKLLINSTNFYQTSSSSTSSATTTLQRKLNARDRRLSIPINIDDLTNTFSSLQSSSPILSSLNNMLITTDIDEENDTLISTPLTSPNRKSATSSLSSPSSSSSSTFCGQLLQHDDDTEVLRKNFNKTMELQQQQQQQQQLQQRQPIETTDESGFSSMNSFQEIGLPLISSTMLSTTNELLNDFNINNSNSNNNSILSNCSFNNFNNLQNNNTILENKNITKCLEMPSKNASSYIHNNNKKNNKKWDESTSYISTKQRSLTTFACSSENDEIGKVLWV